MANPRGNPNFVKKSEEPKEVPQEASGGTHYFFSYPKRFQLHYKDEERYNNGDIKQMATAIEFRDNVKTTKDPEIIECIRKAKSFGTTVRECKNMDEVEKLRQARTLQRMGKMNGPLVDDNLTIEEAPVVPVMGAGS